MRKRVKSLQVKLLGRVSAICMLGAALGACSSDVSRFGSVNPFGNPFSSSSSTAEPTTTGSIGRTASSVSANTPKPLQTAASSAVTSQPLAAPLASPTTTGSIARTTPVAGAAAGWSAQGGTPVQLAQGETIDQLSGRYGVPASAIRSANGLPAGSNGTPGSKVMIPVYNAASGAAPAAARVASVAPSAVATESARETMAPPAAAKPVAATATPQAKAALAADAKVKSAAEAKEKAVAAKAQAEADAKAMAERRARLTAEAKAKADGRPQVSAEQKAEQAELAKARAEEAKAKQELARLKADAKTKELAETKAKSDAKSKTVAAAKAEADAKTKAEAKLKVDAKAKTEAEKKTAAAAKKEQDSKKIVAAKPAEESSDPKTTASVPKDKEKEKVEAAPAEPSADFRWPARGRVISGFSGKGGNEGINISVPEGTPVKAAEGGTVAYAGNELKGYGNLVLIRHPNGYVSAYAHNGALSVKRGDAVKRGQVVATSGQTGNVASPQLHFELRKGSTPVDPSPYLSN